MKNQLPEINISTKMPKVKTPARKKLDEETEKFNRIKWQQHLKRDLKAMKIIGWQEEYAFHPKRKWRFDFAFVQLRLAIEIDGIVWDGKGGHQTGVGYQQDRDKDEAALLQGWTVYRVTPGMVKSGRAIETIQLLLRMCDIL